MGALRRTPFPRARTRGRWVRRRAAPGDARKTPKAAPTRPDIGGTGRTRRGRRGRPGHRKGWPTIPRNHSGPSRCGERGGKRSAGGRVREDDAHRAGGDVGGDRGQGPGRDAVRGGGAGRPRGPPVKPPPSRVGAFQDEKAPVVRAGRPFGSGAVALPCGAPDRFFPVRRDRRCT